ncbi:hypothetical protein SAMN05444001_1129 [Parabacteroides chinchillae]|uniref:Uncharacterized protein n=2 Tax=Parabacteroides chinchillae TaxID=871327 RepID=A0A8G2FB94_9BACT|nr:hypothetical protein SAMN05444001_1129 [Parabacteroides chinchillae]
MIVHFLFEKGSRNFWHYHRMTVTEHSVKDHVIQLHAVSDEEYASSTLNKQDTLTILHPEYKKESKNINIAQNEVKCD